MIFRNPKNFKKGKYIFSRYRKIDLMILSLTIPVSLVSIYLVLTMKSNSILTMSLLLMLAITPAGLGTVLTFSGSSVTFNFLEYLGVVIKYLNRQKKYEWEGVMIDEERQKNETT